jgi:diphosphomevalonate decarboxylase
MWIEASAPSNIALIKYMGKADVKSNRPTNSSLSYSLDKLRTFVRIQKDEGATADHWAPYERTDLLKIQLSEKGMVKFLTHFELLKKEFKMKGFYRIESANNFPSDCGLASSASSFAALTLAAHEWMLKNAEGVPTPYRPKELSKLSQKGSGSSCRSFFSPWALWHHDGKDQRRFIKRGAHPRFNIRPF